MRLVQGWFARSESIEVRKISRGRRRRLLKFESLEDRRVLTSESFDLIGATAYFDNPAFSQYDGTDYAIALIDTGVDMSHPDLGPDTNPADGIPDRIVYQWDFTGFGEGGDADASDEHGHGTHTAGIVAALAPGANLVVLKTAPGTGQHTAFAIEQALLRVAQIAPEHNIVAVYIAAAVQTNLTSAPSNEFLREELEFLHEQHGITTVAAAGNYFKTFDSVPGVSYPAADPFAIAVGATWDAEEDEGAPYTLNGAIDTTTGADRVASFSQRHNDLLDIMAPGALITSSQMGGGSVDLNGTSQSAAHVVAAVALAQHQRVASGLPRLNQQGLVDLLQSTGVEVTDGDDEDDNVTNTDLEFKRLNVLGMAYKLFKPAAVDLKNTSDWGFSETDNKTYDTTPTLTGTVPEGAYVWIYDGSNVIDQFQVAAGVSTFERTLPTPITTIATHNLTIKVAENSGVAEANKSQASTAMPVVIAASDAVTLASQSYAGRLSETLVVSGNNSVASSTLTINWGTSPDPARSLTKTGTGTTTISIDATYNDRTQSVTYNSDAGVTQFTSNVGVPPVGAQAHVANWSVYARKPGASASTIEFQSSQNLLLLNVAAGAKAMMADDGNRALSVFTLDLNAAGTLDLRDNDMIIRASAGTKDAVHANAEARIVSAQNGLDGSLITNWNGTGLTSTFARAENVIAGFDLVGLGVIRNSDLSITTGIPDSHHDTFGGQDVFADDVLVKYTYIGDANLSGVVSFDDYVGMDNAFFELIANLGWATGDINYNGVINFDDYSKVDQAFFFQGDPL